MLARWFYVALVVALAGISALAHEVTYKGTVAAVRPNRYAASDGILARLEIRLDRGGREMSFDITPHTRIWRAQTPISYEAAEIRPNEPVAVTYTDEEPEKGAQEVRLGAS